MANVRSWVAMAALPAALAGCNGGNQTTDLSTYPTAALIPQSQTVYECSGRRYAVEYMDNAVRFHLPDYERFLPQVPAASGSKYQDSAVTFWSKGTEATLTFEGSGDQPCREVENVDPWEHARLRNVAFRGLGQEPGWMLEIIEGQDILYVGDYGETKVLAPATPPIIEPQNGITEYHTSAGGDDLSVIIEDETCHDVMSGHEFEATVTVIVNREEFEGCGRTL